MWDKNNLRYYCPREELKLSSDIETADRRQWNGASKLAVCCEGVTYYISNDWFSNDKPRPTKSEFAMKLLLWAVDACNLLPSEQQRETVVSEETSEKPELVAADRSTTPETTKPDDLKAVLTSLEELHKKIDALNARLDELGRSLNEKIDEMNKEIKTLYELWK